MGWRQRVGWEEVSGQVAVDKMGDRGGRGEPKGVGR